MLPSIMFAVRVRVALPPLLSSIHPSKWLDRISPNYFIFVLNRDFLLVMTIQCDWGDRES